MQDEYEIKLLLLHFLLFVTDQTRQKHLDIHDILFFLFRYSTLFCFHKFVHVILHSQNSPILSLHPSESESRSVMSDSLKSHGLSMEFSRPEYWSRQPFPSPRDLPNPGIQPRFPALQADSLPAEPQGKPKNTGVGSLSLLQWIFLTQRLNQSLLHCRQILYQLSYQGRLSLLKSMSIESVMVSNHLILCPFLLLSSVFHSIRVFSSDSALHIMCPNNQSFSFSSSPSNKYSRLISFRIDWFDLLAVQGV